MRHLWSRPFGRSKSERNSLCKPRVAAEMARAGRAFTIANYSWDAIEGKYLALYERFASGNPD